MKDKHNINRYINYTKSYRRRKRAGNRYAKAVIVIFFAVGLGLSAYFIVKYSLVSYKNDYNQAKVLDNEISAEKINIDENTVTSIETADSTINSVRTANQTVPISPTLIPIKDSRIPTKVKGIYINSQSAGTLDKMEKLIDLVDSTEINAVVIDVKNDTGKISYQMDYSVANEIGSVSNQIKNMEALVQKLKSKGIYLIARIVAFKDPYLAEMKPEYAIKNKDGTIYKDSNNDSWVNPYNKEVWDYLIEISKEASSLGFHEIQFDYIRFSTGSGMDQVDFGEEGKNKSKEEIIIEFTKYVYENLKPLGVYVSADVYGTIISSKIDAGLVGQNYGEMAKYLDYICPMIYPSHFEEGNYGIENPDLEPYEIVRKVLTASKEKLSMIPKGEHRAVVRPWLQDFTAVWLKNYQEYGAFELKEQIRGVNKVGYEEWILWNASCNYSKEGLAED